MTQLISTSKTHIQLAYNQRNSPAYLDMISDMVELDNGVFTCIFKIDQGNICDYLVIENDNYAKTRPTKTD